MSSIESAAPARPVGPAAASATGSAAVPDADYAMLATDAELDRAAANLRARGFEVVVVPTTEDARREALARIPPGAEVFDASSRTLEVTGILAGFGEIPRVGLPKARTRAMDRATQGAEIRRMTQAPDVAIGSVHAVTEDGQVLVASATGNQIGPYAFGAGRVIWVVGAQKIVPTLADGLDRIERYALPLEDERARTAYGRGSAINRILIVRADYPAGRTTVILVRQSLGF